MCTRLLVLAFLLPVGAGAQLTFTKAKPPVIVTSANPTPQESLAARELSDHLGKMIGVTIVPKSTNDPKPGSIVVGLASKWADDKGLDPEEILLRTKGGNLYVLGGGPRGTLYAVNRLLHRQGVRWWTPWATQIPSKPKLQFPAMSIREKPKFESRDPFWFHAFDRDWARRNASNSMHSQLSDQDGGKLVYDGFVHTFYPLVPPEKFFKSNPEWYSLIGGVRRVEGGQLCTTNQQLRAYLVDRIKSNLRAQPAARIVSLSQNDWYGACECPTCSAINQAEGSPVASVLDLVNYVADQIRDEFPEVAVDTLAYQYTRKAPRTMKPRPNVIVRLCSIECDFSKPMTDPANASFAQDVKDWSRLTNRLYIWNYGTSFAHYMLPFPNWFAIGPNQRFFAQNGVKGLFEQGAYQSYGASMAELNAWVQAQLLWNPDQDDKALIREFLKGYYGAAAEPIEKYMKLMSSAIGAQHMGFVANPASPAYDVVTVLEAERLWAQAETAVAKTPDVLWRVKLGHLPVRYLILSRWVQYRRAAAQQKLAWPLPESRKTVADEWFAFAKGAGPKGWSPVTLLNESGLRPEQWITQFAVDPVTPVLPTRVKVNALPADLVIASGAQAISVQDDKARLAEDGIWVQLHPDPMASDGIAARLPGTHHEWALQFLPPAETLTGTWKVYVVARIEPGSDPNATAFHAGVYSQDARTGLAQIGVANGQMGTGYRTILVGSVKLTAGCMIWVAPANAGSKAVWIDRVIFVRES